jgi:hypothetical protein
MTTSTSPPPGDGPVQAFSNELDELDELINKWLDKPEDDKLRMVDIAAILLFKQHNMLQDAREKFHRNPEGPHE